jgi:hypothetical protein
MTARDHRRIGTPPADPRPSWGKGETAVADALRQTKRYGEDSAGFADQLWVSFRIDIDRLAEYA